jgi:predicted nucleotide-binding protein (sugar kinase/HSP70/actin superfamily)
MVDAGYGSVPVISLAMDSSLGNNQPAFKIDWVKIMPIALRAILYSDCIAKFYYATLIRERVKGQADRLKDKYLEIAANLISLDRSKELYRYLAIAAEDFNRALLATLSFLKWASLAKYFLSSTRLLTSISCSGSPKKALR